MDFIYGPASAFDRAENGDFITGFSRKHKFIIAFNSMHYHAFMLLLRLNLENKSDLFDTMMNIAVEINSKEETRMWLKEAIATYPWTKESDV